MYFIFAALGTTVAVFDAPIRLNGITIDDARGSWQTLIAPILSHFKSQALRQAYKVLGSIDLIGYSQALRFCFDVCETELH
jgi:hypothetical protein